MNFLISQIFRGPKLDLDFFTIRQQKIFNMNKLLAISY